MEPLPPPPPAPPRPPTLLEVHQKYAAFVRNLLAKWHFQEADVDDLVQTSFLEIDRSLPNYDPARPIEPWIATIVSRTAQRHLRRVGLRLVAQGSHAADPSDAVPSCAERIEARIMLPRYFASLKKDRQLEAVLRHFHDGEPVAAIASKLGISEDGVYKMLQTAVAKLKAARERFDATERRQFKRRRALLLPLGPSLRVQAWFAKLRAMLVPSLKSLGATLGSVGAAAGLIVADGAVPQRAHMGAPRETSAPMIAVAARENSAATMASDDLAMDARVPPPMSSTAKPALRPRANAHADGAEQASLRFIKAMLKANPRAARAALERHKKTFPQGGLGDEREALEAMARAEIERRRRMP